VSHLNDEPAGKHADRKVKATLAFPTSIRCPRTKLNPQKASHHEHDQMPLLFKGSRNQITTSTAQRKATRPFIIVIVKADTIKHASNSILISSSTFSLAQHNDAA
jgi:hypothetical protein